MPFKPKIGVKTSSVAHLDLLHPERLTAASFEAAVAAFGNAIMSASTCDAILLELLEQPLWAEVVLSAVPDYVFAILKTALVGEFPKSVAAFDASIAARLVQRLSMSLFVLPCGRSSDTLLEHNRELALLVPALLALPKFGFGAPMSPESPEDEYGSFAIKKKKSQKAAKRGRQASAQALPDPAIFDRCDVDYPETREDVDVTEEYLLGKIRRILKDYLNVLRRVEFGDAIRDAYLAVHAPPEHLPEPLRVSSQHPADVPAATAEEVTATSTFPLAQSMRASLYFDTADGFGEWRVLMAGRVVRHLQVACKRQPKRFDIYMKKIKEISNGMFSPDNQKRLSGPGTEVPVFEAKMTADSRLVYTVDCLPEFNSEVEQQVICVWGIYTHAQLDKRFWESMSFQLGRKGKEYRRRCIFRNQPVNKGDYVFLPATFNEPLAQASLEPLSIPSMVRPEDLEEIHSLMVLEKFVTLSQPLLNSILADQDAQHVFNVSPHEKKIIEHSSSCYVLGRSGTGKTTTMLFKMLGIERSWEMNREMHARPRQIFVTQSRVLASKVEEYFTKLLESLAAAHGSAEEVERAAKAMERLVDEDEEENWRGTLPPSFSQLEDNHFPLFVTYDRLCKLLEADIGVLEPSHVRSPTAESISSPIITRAEGSSSMISYSDFLGSYWGHFPQSLTKGLDPALVYSEFLGVIKGSELTRERDEGYLDRDTYLNLSHRSNSTFASQRDVIWKLFEVYLKRKRSLGHRDAADRTHNILKHWQTCALSGPQVDFLYVDEAQDNLLVDALLLRSICRNPDGLFWAGDTAQTIANGGSAFRFDDLKSFLYRVEMELKKRKDYPIKSANPQAFQLAVNYRSHGGIVNCASSIIRIVTQLWPYSIDVMQEESGIVDGLKPVVFSGWDEKTIRYEQFLFGEGGSHMEFGAHQCILVRNDAARNKLRREVGDIGLIMTLYESKGLEFNDVLLFNFFEDSTVELAQWRVLLNMLPTQSRGNVPCPRFDEMRHAGVCAELKFLYVAITRARKNLWIIDCSDKGEPVRAFWTAHDLIQNCVPGSKVPQLAVSSTAEEWAKSGRTLFRSKRYFQAMHCFERASMPREMAISNAYLLRETARNVLGGSKTQGSERALAFASAADAFVQCAENEKGEEQATYFRVAAECYAKAEDHLKAGQAFYAASEYTLSARHYRKGNYFDEAVSVVQKHPVEATFATTLIDIAKFYYITSGTPEKAAPLFDTIDDQLDYMEEADLDVARANLLESEGRISEAADVHMMEGRPMKALALLLDDKHNPGSIRCAKDQLLKYLWRHLSFGVVLTANTSNVAVKELLQLAERLDPTYLSQHEADELAMFRAISINDLASLRQLAVKFLTTNARSAALHCLDHVFRGSPGLQNAPDQVVLTYLRYFYEYAALMRTASQEASPRSQGLRRLFALSFNEADDTYFAPVGTHLHTHVTEKSWPCLQSTDEGSTFSSNQILEHIPRALTERLGTRVNQHDGFSSKMIAFEPCCIQHAIFPSCRGPCTGQHVDVRSIDKTWYSRRVGVHLMQIMVLQTAQGLLTSHNRAHQQQIWLSKLYEAMFPPHFSFGSPGIWDRSLLPETSRAADIARHWLREFVNNLDPWALKSRFLGLFMQANALAKILDEQAFTDYIGRARCMIYVRPRELMRPPEGDYVLNDCVAMTLGTDRSAAARGFLFASHVLETRRPMDISVFCNYLDQICIMLSVSDRLNRHYYLNDIMLPRNWLLWVVQQPHQPEIQEGYLNILKKFLIHLSHVLVYLGREDDGPPQQEWVYFAGKPFSKHPFTTKHLFMARICRSLNLMAYNTTSVRKPLFDCLRAANRYSRRPHHIYAEYVEVKTTFQLTNLARRAAGDSSLDEMVHVFHRPLLPTGLRDIHGVRRVVYANWNDLVPLLENRSTLRAAAPEFKPREVVVAQAVPDDVEPEPEPEENTAGDDVDGEGPELEHTLVNVTQVHTVPEEEHTAASHIQKGYKRYLRRKQPEIEDPLTSSRRALFDQLSKVSEEINFTNSVYQKIYLGPLAHALLCADKVQQWVYEHKRKTKRQLQKLKAEDLEDIRARQTKTNTLLKRARDVQKALEPKSEIHAAQDIAKLRQQITCLEELFRELPMGTVGGIADDLQLAIKAIVQEEEVIQQPAKLPKPPLVLDDPYDLFEDL